MNVFNNTKKPDVFKEFYKKTFPIEERINNRELNVILNEELKKNNININYKYGVYNNDLATKLKSRQQKTNHSNWLWWR